jgi:hypothetical protein
MYRTQYKEKAAHDALNEHYGAIISGEGWDVTERGAVVLAMLRTARRALNGLSPEESDAVHHRHLSDIVAVPAPDDRQAYPDEPTDPVMECLKAGL